MTMISNLLEYVLCAADGRMSLAKRSDLLHDLLSRYFSGRVSADSSVSQYMSGQRPVPKGVCATYYSIDHPLCPPLLQEDVQTVIDNHFAVKIYDWLYYALITYVTGHLPPIDSAYMLQTHHAAIAQQSYAHTLAEITARTVDIWTRLLWYCLCCDHASR